MSERCKIMVRMATNSMPAMDKPSLKNKPAEYESNKNNPVENESVVENVVENGESNISAASFDQSLQEPGNMPGPSQSYNTVVRRRSTSSCSSASSSSSRCSSSSSESSSEDCEDIINDQTYVPGDDCGSDSDKENLIQNRDDEPDEITTITTTSFSAMQDVPILTSPPKKGIKRKKNEGEWKRNLLKKLRNSGMAYELHTKSKRIRNERMMKPACGEKCKLQCSTKFSEDERKELFLTFWGLADIEKQRQFIANSMQVIQPKYRYVRVGGVRSQRNNNNAFYFHQHNQQIRVCKLFFKNTLDINDRPIRTVLAKKNKVVNVLMESDLRGKHGKQKAVDPILRDGIKQHIDSIPKIESHYTRANTSRHFIDGSKSIADIHKDYVSNCKEKKIPFANYTLFYRVFTQEYNISFFVPKKDLCDTCTAFENTEGNEKERLRDNYDRHLIEKDLSRAEKKADKENPNVVVAVYDLQAVMQLPKGDVSQFYYKSKLNVLNFTIYNLKTNTCDCFVWDEGNGHRGVNELGTCVLLYLRKILSTTDDPEIIFYSDNCAGQQKNKFMLALYLYAVRYLGIKSITHKYLIKGHTQNEGDSAHSLIERQVKRILKSGPIYTPESFISAIRSARKTGEPFHVTELCYEDFYDLKTMASDMGPLNMSALKLTDVKVLKVVRDSPTSAFYKNSYTDDFKEVTIIKRKKKDGNNNFTLIPSFSSRPGIPEQKKEGLLELIKKNLIPKYYKTFYENL